MASYFASAADQQNIDKELNFLLFADIKPKPKPPPPPPPKIEHKVEAAPSPPPPPPPPEKPVIWKLYHPSDIKDWNETDIVTIENLVNMRLDLYSRLDWFLSTKKSVFHQHPIIIDHKESYSRLVFHRTQQDYIDDHASFWIFRLCMQILFTQKFDERFKAYSRWLEMELLLFKIRLLGSNEDTLEQCAASLLDVMEDEVTIETVESLPPQNDDEDELTRFKREAFRWLQLSRGDRYVLVGGMNVLKYLKPWNPTGPPFKSLWHISFGNGIGSRKVLRDILIQKGSNVLHKLHASLVSHRLDRDYVMEKKLKYILPKIYQLLGPKPDPGIFDDLDVKGIHPELLLNRFTPACIRRMINDPNFHIDNQSRVLFTRYFMRYGLNKDHICKLLEPRIKNWWKNSGSKNQAEMNADWSGIVKGIQWQFDNEHKSKNMFSCMTLYHNPADRSRGIQRCPYRDVKQDPTGAMYSTCMTQCQRSLLADIEDLYKQRNPHTPHPPPPRYNISYKLKNPHVMSDHFVRYARTIGLDLSKTV